MATSGEIRPGSNSVYAKWTLVSQSTTNNQSVINVQFGWGFHSSPLDRQLDNADLHVNGAVIVDIPGRVKDYQANFTPRDHVVFSGNITIPHNADGTKTFGIFAGMTGFSGFRSEASGAWALPAIPRQPGAPGTPTFSNLQATSVTVSWTAPSNVGSGLTQRNIEIATDPGFANKVVNHTASWDTFYQASGLSKGTQYWVRVRAASAAGWGPYSAVSTFTTPATVPGAPPQPSVSSVGMTSATVSWSAPSDTGGSAITGYDVQRATDSGFSTNVVTVSDNASPNVLTSLTPNTPYWVRVRAKNAQGAGAWSASRQFTTSTNVYAANGSTYVPITVLAGNGSTYVPITIGLGNGSTYV